MPESPEPPKVGDTLADKYVLEARVGGGGMGIVYRARHLLLDEHVAVKLLTGPATPAATTRLLREARAAARLQSEHVVRVLDVAALPGGAPYLVLEFLRGRDLSRHLRACGSVSPETAAAWVLQACEALAQAHRAGIVHRDIKPSNLFLTETNHDPVLKVLDFGIAKWQSADASSASLTQSDRLLGSPRYMSPEQIRGSRGLGPATDVWSLGVVLHELIAGTPPFVEEAASAVLAAIVADPPEPLGVAAPGVPAPLAELVARCLDKEASRRCTLVELAEGLAALAGNDGPKLLERVRRASDTAKPAELAGNLDRREDTTLDPTDSRNPTDALGASSSHEQEASRTNATWEERPRTRSRQPRWLLALAIPAGAAIVYVAFWTPHRAVSRGAASDSAPAQVAPRLPESTVSQTPTPAPQPSSRPASTSASAIATSPRQVPVPLTKPPSAVPPPPSGTASSSPPAAPDPQPIAEPGWLADPTVETRR